MTCVTNRPYYLPHSLAGILTAVNRGDGYTIGISWTQAYPDVSSYFVGYNLYFSTNKNDVFAEGVKYIISDSSTLIMDLLDFTPGDTFYFAVRAMEYDPSWLPLGLLPDSGDAKIIPEGILTSNLSETDVVIPITDADQFPAFGVVQVGSELMSYTGISGNNLTGVTRGFLATSTRIHTVDGYDGYTTWDPTVKFWKGLEEENQTVLQATCTFAYPNYARTDTDGYMEVTKDILTTDLSGSDASQTGFPAFDYAGYHRTDPVALLRGDCLDTYYGGEYFCADGYDGVGRQLKGIPLQTANEQRQEVLLTLTGEPVVLVQNMLTGKRCKCYMSRNEYPDDRCSICFGRGFITSYKQFFNPRRSDGRILVRFSPAEDDLKMEDSGLESTFLTDAWTITVPAIKDRDFLIRFTEDGKEEFRYEVLNVTRNKLLESLSGAQKMRIQRVRKTDRIYQWKYIADTSTMPQVLTTTIGMVPGPGGIPPHTHTIVINESIISLDQINQTTSVSEGHNHEVINGVVRNVLGHDHEILL